MVEKHLPTTASISVDLPGLSTFLSTLFPLVFIQILCCGMTLRDRWTYLVELTVCYETSFEDAVKRKED